MCDFTRVPTCELLEIGSCSQFVSSVYESYGIRDAYVRVFSNGETLGFRVFLQPGCQGDPFGFQVGEENLELGECRPLRLPFNVNPGNFVFVTSCSSCVREADFNRENSVLPPGWMGLLQNSPVLVSGTLK